MVLHQMSQNILVSRIYDIYHLFFNAQLMHTVPYLGCCLMLTERECFYDQVLNVIRLIDSLLELWSCALFLYEIDLYQCQILFPIISINWSINLNVFSTELKFIRQ